MRYICHVCLKPIKDKFIFGLLHFCLPPDLYEKRIQQLIRDQQNVQPYVRDNQ